MKPVEIDRTLGDFTMSPRVLLVAGAAAGMTTVFGRTARLWPVLLGDLELPGLDTLVDLLATP